MRFRPKKLRDQVVVIIGASSGMGLRTAQLASEKGARVFLVSRSEEGLRKATDEIKSQGGNAAYVVADIADITAMEAVANKAITEFGGIDTWINVAGVGIYGLSKDVPLDEAKQLMDINFWGVVNGTRVAMNVMSEKGGTILNMGSVESDRAMPYHSFYAASKQAIKGYTDALRMEIEKENTPIALTLLKPASINTLFVEHSRSWLPDGEQPRFMPPVYDTDVAARAILACCEYPLREITIGGSGKTIAATERLAPRLLDKVFELTAFRSQVRNDLPADRGHNLFGPTSNEARIRGNHNGYVSRTSLSTAMTLHPWRTAFIAVAALTALGGAINYISTRREDGASRLSLK